MEGIKGGREGGGEREERGGGGERREKGEREEKKERKWMIIRLLGKRNRSLWTIIEKSLKYLFQ